VGSFASLTPYSSLRSLTRFARMTLFIFDLNGTLLYRRYIKDNNHSKTHPSAKSTRVGNHLVWVRPMIKNFMKTKLDEGHHLAVWTSMTRANSVKLVDLVFGDLKSHLTFVWTQEDCLVVPGDTKEKPLMFKPLARVWTAFPRFDRTNTILVDDSPQKTILNPEGCFWQIPTFEGDHRDRALVKGVKMGEPIQDPLLQILKNIEEVRRDRSWHLNEVKSAFEDGEWISSEEAKYLTYIFLSMSPDKDIEMLLVLEEILVAQIPNPKDRNKLLKKAFKLIDAAAWLFPRYLSIMSFLGFTPRGDGVIEEIEISEGLKNLIIK